MFSSKGLACVASALFFFYSIASLSFFNVISQNLIGEFSLTPEKLGLLSSGYLYANALWLIPAGFLFDKFSTRQLMLGAMLTDVIGIFIMCLSHTTPEIFIGRILCGSASAFVLLGTVRTGVKLYPGKHAGKAIGFMISFGVLGGSFGNSFFSLLENYVNWHTSALLFGVLGILIFMFLFQMNTAMIQRTQPVLKNIVSIFKNPANWLAGLYIGLMNLPVFILASLWGEIYLTKVQALSAGEAAQISGLIFFGVMIGSSFFGYASDRMGRRKPLLWIGAVLSMAFMLLLIFAAPPLNPWYAGALFLLIGFSIASQVIIYPLIAEMNPTEVSSMAQGLASTINNLIGAVMQAVFGYIIMSDTHVQTYQRGMFNHGLTALLLAFLCAFVIVFVLRETFCRMLNPVGLHSLAKDAQ
ncbi:MAG: MFS transporter [Gammaproteobacteria bacterium]|nr:MFS transporter [Gammaproteobacteria bacterium]